MVIIFVQCIKTFQNVVKTKSWRKYSKIGVNENSVTNIYAFDKFSRHSVQSFRLMPIAMPPGVFIGISMVDVQSHIMATNN